MSAAGSVEYVEAVVMSVILLILSGGTYERNGSDVCCPSGQ